MNDEIQTIKLKLIDPSPLNPRKTIGDLTELVATMEEHGLITPILVRPVGKRFEFVNGHRRGAAAGELGWKDVKALVRELSDKEALEIMLVDNSSRVDVPPLEEAEAFANLVELGNSVEEVALKTGKSKGHVYKRLKLCGLCEEARGMVTIGTLSLEAALVLARLEDKDEQVQVLDRLDTWGTVTPDDVKYELNRTLRVLKDAPFDREDAMLTSAGACTSCPKRTGAQAALFEEADDGRDRCTDGGCWKEKVAAHGEEILTAARVKGHAVLEGDEAAKVFKPGRSSPAAGWVDLGADAQDLGVEGKKKLKTLLGKGAKKVVAVDHEGRAHELVKKSEALKILQEKGLVEKAARKTAPSKRKVPETDVPEEEHERALVAAVVSATARAYGAEPLEFVRRIVKSLAGACIDGVDEALTRRAPDKKLNASRRRERFDALLAEAQTMPQVLALAVEVDMYQAFWDYDDDRVAAYAAFVGVDPNAVRADLIAKRDAELLASDEQLREEEVALGAAATKKAKKAGKRLGPGLQALVPETAAPDEGPAEPTTAPAGKTNVKGAELVLEVGLLREEGWLYYLDKDCNIARSQTRRGKKRQEPTVEVVYETSVVRDAAFLYFLGEDGDLYRRKLCREKGRTMAT